MITITKTYEKAQLAQWIESLPPNSYLRPLMDSIKLDIERAVDGDFTFVDFSAHYREQLSMRHELTTLQNAIAAAKAVLRDLEKNTTAARDTLQDLQRMAKRITEIHL